ncbi:MAG: hypothetical protein ACPG4N_03985 [Gammaproteobacteria bacterium]
MALIIPTRHRDELPDGFDYPLWPSVITEAMRGKPQFEDMELVFHWRDEFWQSRWAERVLNGGVVTLLEAEYLVGHSPYFPAWKITINSVPHEFINVVREYLLNEGLEQFADSVAKHEAAPEHDVHVHETFELKSARPIEVGDFEAGYACG